MPHVPAFCSACNLIFPSPFTLVNSTGITFQGIGVSCPRCGHDGRILDGVYDSLGDTIQALLKLSLEDLQSLLKSLQQSKKGNEDDQIRDAFSHHGMMAQSFLKVAKEPQKRIAILTLICLIINMLINGYNAYHQKGITKEEVEAMISKAIDAQSRAAAPLSQPPAPRNRAERRKAKHK